MKKLKSNSKAIRSNSGATQLCRPAVVYVAGECEWEGVYVQGAILDQNHSLSAGNTLEAVLAALGIPFERIEVKQEWMDAMGHLPEDLKLIPRRARVPQEGDR